MMKIPVKAVTDYNFKIFVIVTLSIVLIGISLMLYDVEVLQ